MAEVNWNNAPEGATHLLYGVWRKIHDDDHEYWDRKLNVWVGYGIKNVQELIRVHKDFIIERPPQAPEQPQVVIINGVEVDWGKAPEGTTHAATDLAAIRAYGQWRKLEDNTVSDWRGGEWVERNFIDAEEWKIANRGLFIEKPGLVAAAPVAKKGPVAKEQQAAPQIKKPIGWWA